MKMDNQMVSRESEVVKSISPGERTQAGWRKVLVVLGWFLRITGIITMVGGTAVLVVWGIFAPAFKDVSSAILSVAFGYGDFYYGGKVVEFDQSGLKGVLLVQGCLIVVQAGYLAWGVRPAGPLLGNIAKALVVMVLVYLGYRRAFLDTNH